MTVQKFRIKTVKRLETSPVEFKKTIVLSSGKKVEKSFNDYVIDIHSIEAREGLFEPIRDNSSFFDLVLLPEWSTAKAKDLLREVIFEDEIVEDALILNVFLIATESKEVIELRKVRLTDIDSSKEIRFMNIDPNKYFGKIELQSSIVRTKSHPFGKSLLADRKYAIVAENNSIAIYLDEVISIGSNYLDIMPASLGRLLFRIKDWQESGVDHPQLLYNSELDKYLRGGDYYNSVQNFLMMALIVYSDHNLKWILFSNNFSEVDEYHLSIVDFIAKLINIKRADLIEKSKLECDEKLREYLIISKELLECIQDADVNYKQMLKAFIERDIKSI